MQEKKVIACELPFPKEFIHGLHQMYFLMGKRLEKKFLDAKFFTFSQFWVIHCILVCAHDSENSQAEIAKGMFVSEATISKHIEKLQKLKFLKSEIDPKSRRRHILKVTEKGKVVYEKAQKVLNQELEKIFYKIKESDKKIILKNFVQILENINNN